MRTIKIICVSAIVTLLLWSVYAIGVFAIMRYDTIKNLGGGYEYFDGQLAKDRVIKISDIESYNYNSKIIIIKQKYRSHKDIFFQDEIEYPLGSSVDTTYYWIVNKKTDDILGPMLKPQYLAAKDSMNIALTLSKNYSM